MKNKKIYLSGASGYARLSLYSVFMLRMHNVVCVELRVTSNIFA